MKVQALRRVLGEYELSTSQDLLSLAHWLAQELKAIPTEALNKSLSYLTEGNPLLQLTRFQILIRAGNSNMQICEIRLA